VGDSIEYLKTGLQIVKNCDDVESIFLKSKLYNNLGNAYRKIKDYDNSFKYYNMCMQQNNLFTYYIACFNVGSMLIDKGDLLPAMTYIEKAYNSGNRLILDFLESKGLTYLVENQSLKDSIIDFHKKKFNSAIVKLKSIYKSNDLNPVVNFFLAYNYISQKKFEKANCFFDKLMKINEKFQIDKRPFLKKLVTKAKLIQKKMFDFDQDLEESYIEDLLSFEDFAILSEIEEYEDVFEEESLHNKINTQFNIILSTKRGSKLIFKISRWRIV
jgi:tetratricopeptide (TPR) repeat protein